MKYQWEILLGMGPLVVLAIFFLFGITIGSMVVIGISAGALVYHYYHRSKNDRRLD